MPYLSPLPVCLCLSPSVLPASTLQASTPHMRCRPGHRARARWGTRRGQHGGSKGQYGATCVCVGAVRSKGEERGGLVGRGQVAASGTTRREGGAQPPAPCTMREEAGRRARAWSWWSAARPLVRMQTARLAAEVGSGAACAHDRGRGRSGGREWRHMRACWRGCLRRRPGAGPPEHGRCRGRTPSRDGAWPQRRHAVTQRRSGPLA